MGYLESQDLKEHVTTFFYLSEIERQEHVPKEERILGKYYSKKKTKWKAWGNRFTDFIVVTDLYVIYVHLIKWFGWPANKGASTFRVNITPIKRITSVHEVRKGRNRHEICIQFTDAQGEKCQYNVRFGSETKKIITLINSRS